MITEELKKLYIAHTGHEPEQIDELPSSGSNRRYFRLIGSPTLIGVSGESVEENRAFLYMAEHFRQKGLPVPQVFIRSEDDIYYLQEDHPSAARRTVCRSRRHGLLLLLPAGRVQ